MVIEAERYLTSVIKQELLLSAYFVNILTIFLNLFFIFFKAVYWKDSEKCTDLLVFPF